MRDSETSDIHEINWDVIGVLIKTSPIAFVLCFCLSKLCASIPDPGPHIYARWGKVREYISYLEALQAKNARQGLRPWVDLGLPQDAFDALEEPHRLHPKTVPKCCGDKYLGEKLDPDGG